MAVALAAIAAISAGYTIYNAEHQKAQAKKLRNDYTRPAYEIPAATKAIVNKSAFEAGKFGLPGQDKIQAELDRNSASTRRSIKESGLSPIAMMQAFSASEQNNDMANEKLGIEAAKYKDQAQGRYMASLQGLAGEQKAQWNIDKFQPYDNAMAAASALTNAGMRNEEAGIHDALQSASNIALMNKMGYFNNGSGGREGYGAPNNGGYFNDGSGQWDMNSLKAQYEQLYGPMSHQELMLHLNSSPETK